MLFRSDKAICKGSSVTLSGSATGLITWSPATGLSSNTIANPVANPSTTTNYTITATSSAGCTATDVVTVTVNLLPAASITPSGTVTVCNGDSVVLSANSGVGLTYQWKKMTSNISGAVGQTYTVKAASTYKVLVTNSNGCTKLSPGTVVAFSPTSKITASGPITFCNGDSVVLNATIGSGYLYQWRKGTTAISGATQSSLVVKSAGTYRCLITDSNGCTGLSNSLNVTVNCRINGSETKELMAYASPNPFDGQFIFNFQSANSNPCEITIIDSEGRLVENMILAEDVEEVILGDKLQSGFYMLTAKQGDMVKHIKLIKK